MPEDRAARHIAQLNLGGILSGVALGTPLRWASVEIGKLRNEGHKNEAALLEEMWEAGKSAQAIVTKGVKSMTGGELQKELRTIQEAGAVFPRKIREELFQRKVADLMKEAGNAAGFEAFLDFIIPWSGENEEEEAFDALNPKLSPIDDIPTADKAQLFMQSNFNYIITMVESGEPCAEVLADFAKFAAKKYSDEGPAEADDAFDDTLDQVVRPLQAIQQLMDPSYIDYAQAVQETLPNARRRNGKGGASVYTGIASAVNKSSYWNSKKAMFEAVLPRLTKLLPVATDLLNNLGEDRAPEDMFILIGDSSKHLPQILADNLPGRCCELLRQGVWTAFQRAMDAYLGTMDSDGKGAQHKIDQIAKVRALVKDLKGVWSQELPFLHERDLKLATMAEQTSTKNLQQSFKAAVDAFKRSDF